MILQSLSKISLIHYLLSDLYMCVTEKNDIALKNDDSFKK